MAALVTGFTAIVDEAFIRAAFDCPVVVLTNFHKRQKNITWVEATPDLTYKDLVNTHDIDRVVYISPTLSLTETNSWNIGDLLSCLESIKNFPETKFAYIGSNRVLQDRADSQKVACKSMENLCGFFRDERGADLLIVRSPYLCNPSMPADFLYQTFDALEKQGAFTLPGPPTQMTNNLSTDDLADFLRRLFTDWRPELKAIDLIAPQAVSLAQVKASLQEIFPTARLAFDNSPVETIMTQTGENSARDFYKWDAQGNPLADLQGCHDRYADATNVKLSLTDRAKTWFRRHSKAVVAVEIIVGALIVQALVGAFSSNVQFRMIDLRLLYIVLIAIAYGVAPGLLAAGLMCVSLASAYVLNGMDLASLFLWFENWVPFILYFALGASLGTRM